MEKTYELGADDSIITAGVTVGTTGVAKSEIYLSRADGTFKDIAQSNAESGNIDPTIIGKAKDLKTDYIVIYSLIDFSNLEKPLWKNALKSTIITYEIDGGFDGYVKFTCQEDEMVVSENGKVASITTTFILKS